jgi:protein-S-isoprenylcysteine O-methyltransferase Ste14
MLNISLPPAVLFVLRDGLFLGPLSLTVLLMNRLGVGNRRRVGALFSLLYGLGLVFVGHVAAIRLGMWSYGGASMQLLGFPADIWFAGALLWGPVLFLAFPRTSPWILVLPCIALNGLVLPALIPFVMPGRFWFPGVVLVFLTAHLPALYLARWTSDDTNLPLRAFLLAIGHGCVAFFVLPTVIMQAMGGDWSALTERPAWILAPAGLVMVLLCVIGLSAVQMFALHGGGTPIPLDPTKRLVRTGLYAYVSNSMQLCTASGWLVIGAVLANIWVACAAVMAVCFVLGMVRWHHRQDLEIRFPQGWPEYRAHVPEWWPRWRPWIPIASKLRYDPTRPFHRCLISGLAQLGAQGLDLRPEAGCLCYQEANETREFRGLAAMGKALNHGNLVTAILGSALLLIVLPAGYLARLVAASLTCVQARQRA